jgi:uncharacterized protein YbaR (Trm112 family)
MKIFSLFLLQCKEDGCRIENHLLLKEGELAVGIGTPSDTDLEFIEKHIKLILSTDSSGKRLLESIKENLGECCIREKNTEAGIKDVLGWFPDEQSLREIEGGAGAVGTLGMEKCKKLFNLLFSVYVLEGGLECSKCGARYPIHEGIADFVGK